MGNVKFNFAAVFSIMVLLAFSYITFMGLDYLKGGDLLLPIVLTVGFILLVIVCIAIMCASKATRWHRVGIIGQVFFGIVILAAFIASAFPFTNFMRVVNDKENITNKVKEACNSATNLDNAYVNYVDTRIEKYKENLSLISRGKNINPTRYRECLGEASGNTDEAKIEGLAKSLRNKLLPSSTTKIVEERHNWLDGAKNANVWNPLTPANINKIDQQVNGWLANYQKLSSISYQGEDTKPFEYENFSSSLKILTDTYKKIEKPQNFALVVSIICFIIMLLPYWLTEKEIAGRQSKRIPEGKHLFNKSNEE